MCACVLLHACSFHVCFIFWISVQAKTETRPLREVILHSTDPSSLFARAVHCRKHSCTKEGHYSARLPLVVWQKLMFPIQQLGYVYLLGECQVVAVKCSLLTLSSRSLLILRDTVYKLWTVFTTVFVLRGYKDLLELTNNDHQQSF